jgi:DNA-binding MarR family transcriptional regulator
VADDIQDKISGDLLALLPFYHKRVFKAEHGISGMQAAQYRVLGLLMSTGILPMSVIGKRLYISKPYMTVLIDSLVEGGHVERLPDAGDRLVINIAITNKGKTYLKHAGAMYKNDVKALLADLDEHDLEELCRSLENLRGILAKIP